MAVILSFLTAFVLTLLPLPDWANAYRPDWVALVLIYWCLDLPHRIGPGVGWVAGLMLDITQASLLGGAITRSKSDHDIRAVFR